MSTPSLMVFVPGYATSREEYIDIAEYVRSLGHLFEFIAIANNNYGDRGCTTMDTCIELVIARYNLICTQAQYANIPIVLAGHSMGGLLVLRMVSNSCFGRLLTKPTRVVPLNPSLAPVVFPLLPTIGSFLPTVLLGTIPIPVLYASPGALYENSPPMRRPLKPQLLFDLLRKTNTLYIHNDPWDLMPDESMKNFVCIICNTGDKITKSEASLAYGHRYGVLVRSVPSNLHQRFDDTLMDLMFAFISVGPNP